LLRSSSIEDILCLCGFAIGGFSSGRDNRSCGNYKVKDEGGVWTSVVWWLSNFIDQSGGGEN
jgi:hypothetical protein